MTAKPETRFFPNLLNNRHYLGTLSTLLYNWPIFASLLFFGLVTLTAGFLLSTPWDWLVSSVNYRWQSCCSRMEPIHMRRRTIQRN